MLSDRKKRERVLRKEAIIAGALKVFNQSGETDIQTIEANKSKCNNLDHLQNKIINESNKLFRTYNGVEDHLVFDAFKLIIRFFLPNNVFTYPFSRAISKVSLIFSLDTFALLNPIRFNPFK